MRYKLIVVKNGEKMESGHKLLSDVMSAAFAHGVIPDVFEIYDRDKPFARMVNDDGRFALVDFEEVT